MDLPTGRSEPFSPSLSFLVSSPVHLAGCEWVHGRCSGWLAGQAEGRLSTSLLCLDAADGYQLQYTCDAAAYRRRLQASQAPS